MPAPTCTKPRKTTAFLKARQCKGEKGETMIIAGCGALNLDLIFEITDIDIVARLGIGLEPGRECVMDHQDATDLLTVLKKEAKLLAKSGGGSAANTLCALSRMGHRCFFIGTVGEDNEGEFLLDSMKGVDCSLVNRSGKSSLCIVVIDRLSQDRALAVVPGSLAIDPDEPKTSTILENCRLFHLSSLAQEDGPDLQGHLTALCPSSCIVSFDPGEVYAAKGYKKIKKILLRTWLLSASDVEFEQIFGKKSVMEVISKGLFGSKIQETMEIPFDFFKKMPPPILAKKSGARGALLASTTSIYSCPARDVEKIVDNTGAGDAFDAGLIHAIFSNKGPKKALEDAVSVAAFSIMSPGRTWIDHLDEVIIHHQRH